MLMTIILILGIAYVGLALFNGYVVPMFAAVRAKGPDDRILFSVMLSALVALIAIVLAILVGFHVVIIPSGW